MISVAQSADENSAPAVRDRAATSVNMLTAYRSADGRVGFVSYTSAHRLSWTVRKSVLTFAESKRLHFFPPEVLYSLRQLLRTFVCWDRVNPFERLITGTGRDGMRQRRKSFEFLESRVCMTVLPALMDGNLLIAGDAFGELEIAGRGAGSFDIIEGGQLVATVDSVTGGVLVQLEYFLKDVNDSVVINLEGQAVDFIHADLGGGQNNLELRTGEVPMGAVYRGGPDADNVVFGEDLHLGAAGIFLGDGANSVEFKADVDWLLTVVGGDDADDVLIAQQSHISGVALASLGNGSNALSHAGSVDLSMQVFGGADDDLVEILPGGVVGQSVGAWLGSGTNRLEHQGTIGDSLSYFGGAGTDSVQIGLDGRIGRSALLLLGEGNNDLTHAGYLGQQLVYQGGDGIDVIELTETATVGGWVYASLGRGANVFRHDGSIEGDLIVRSEDRGSIFEMSEEAFVGGRLIVCLWGNCDK